MGFGSQESAGSGDNVTTIERASSGRFAVGYSGNPAGRPPKGHALAERLRTKLEQIHPIEQARADQSGAAPRSSQDAILDQLIHDALDPEGKAADRIKAADLIFSRVDGKVVAPAIKNDKPDKPADEEVARMRGGLEALISQVQATVVEAVEVTVQEITEAQ